MSATNKPIQAYAALEAKQALVPFEYTPSATLQDGEVELNVESSGLCHSDLSMLDNEWGMTTYPFVGGHEVIGTVAVVGAKVTSVKVGDRVGLGWFSGFCEECEFCTAGKTQYCVKRESTIISRHGGFADRVRSSANALVPIPEGINPDHAGPFLCAGSTVWAPLEQYNIKATHKVAVIGIGGLGHLAIQFYKAWGCEVTAFTSASKVDEALQMGATDTIDSRSQDAIKAAAGKFDFILSTVAVEMNWGLIVGCLRPEGRLNFVGIPPKLDGIHPFQLLSCISVSGSGQPTVKDFTAMLKFAARNKIAPIVEVFPFGEINKAITHLQEGKARYRVVLKH